MTTVERLVFPSKALAPMLVTPGGIIMLSRLVFPSKVLSAMEVILSGKITLERLVERAKAPAPIEETPWGRLILVRPEPAKAWLPMKVRVSGKDIYVRLVVS